MITTPRFLQTCRRSVGNWSATDRGLVADLAGTWLRLNQSHPGFWTCTKSWLRLMWSQEGPRLISDFSATSSGPIRGLVATSAIGENCQSRRDRRAVATYVWPRLNSTKVQYFYEPYLCCLNSSLISKNKTNNQISSNSHPSATANKAIHSLKIGGYRGMFLTLWVKRVKVQRNVFDSLSKHNLTLMFWKDNVTMTSINTNKSKEDTSELTQRQLLDNLMRVRMDQK